MKKFYLSLLGLIIFISLSHGQNDTMYIMKSGNIIGKYNVNEIDSIVFYHISAQSGKSINGFAQKGPFVSGSSITVYDLLNNLNPTGKSYLTNISNNKGTFKLDNVTPTSNYVSLKADGYYFNEISGKQSISQITLNALADISNKSGINVNILTHLEKARVEYLMNQGKSFSQSKTQAKNEILAIFNIEGDTISMSENMNIAESGEDNAILLAISAILQGYRTEAEMTELLSNISDDINEDGALDNSLLGSLLINHAAYLDTVSIKNNLVKRYNDMGSAVNVPYFGKYIKNFKEKTLFPVTNTLIGYPSQGLYGANILSLSDTVYARPDALTSFSLSADLPQNFKLKVKITSLSYKIEISESFDTISYDPLVIEQTFDTTKIADKWAYYPGSAINVAVSNFDFSTNTQLFTVIESGKSCDLNMIFDKGTFLVEYYEMNAVLPTRKKRIVFQ